MILQFEFILIRESGRFVLRSSVSYVETLKHSVLYCYIKCVYYFKLY